MTAVAAAAPAAATVFDADVGSTAPVTEFVEFIGDAYRLKDGFRGGDISPDHHFVHTLSRPPKLTAAIVEAGIDPFEVFFEIVGFRTDEAVAAWVEARDGDVPPEGYWVAAFGEDNADGVMTGEVVLRRIL